MSKNEIVNVKQFCPTARVDVIMSVQGEMRGVLVEGKIVDCSFKNCILYKSKKCWIGSKILTVVENTTA